MVDLKQHFWAVLATFLIAGSFISSEILSDVINPISLTLLRFVIATLALLPFILFKQRYRSALPRALPRYLLLSLFFAIFFICMFEALKTTTALNTGTLYTLVPFMTAILSIFVLKERVTQKLLQVYLIGTVGTCWVVFGGNIDAVLAFSLKSGDALFLGGCVSMVIFSVFMKRVYRGDDMMVTVFCTMLGGSLWMLLALIMFDEPLHWSLLETDLWLHMGYLSIFATLVSTFMIQKTTITLGPTKVMAYIYLNPAFVALILLFFKGESIPIIVLPGMLISLIATIILQRHSQTHESKVCEAAAN